MLTVRAFSVELFNRVVETNSDRRKAHLPLESCHQPTVKTQRTLSTHHGGDGAEHPSILHRRAAPCSSGASGLSLDLCNESSGY